MQPIKTPEMLEIAAERMFLDITEPLDAYVSLKLVQVVRGLVGVAYAMGHQDAGRSSIPAAPCDLCPHRALGGQS